MTVKYPNISINIVNAGSNPLVLITRLKSALEQGGIEKKEVDDIIKKILEKGTIEGIIRYLYEIVEVIDSVYDKEIINKY